ncbi:hypothetical protein CERSUDRAFT_88026 [Gelatoporia subvermispora B]|uniref:Uncharacterized protein n=1 Tax=Ceriporiopsis subvermispora (strain B) TaxID=914234 RepID=M2PA78_CERS8|nr:hypothetical protein CERSUDRAFT_88026 [Gelatoporia subvermispora B]
MTASLRTQIRACGTPLGHQVIGFACLREAPLHGHIWHCFCGSTLPTYPFLNL